MRREFMQSNVTLRELAKRHGASYRHVSGLSAKERWYPQRAQLQQQAEHVASEALMKRVSERSSELAKLKVATTEQHIQRSLQTGEHLNALLQQGLAALQAQDTRALKATIEAWVKLDDQMRKIHKVDTTQEKPLVDIRVLAALPPKSEMLRRRAEAEAVEAA